MLILLVFDFHRSAITDFISNTSGTGVRLLLQNPSPKELGAGAKYKTGA